jgi:hypothetical protein
VIYGHQRHNDNLYVLRSQWTHTTLDQKDAALKFARTGGATLEIEEVEDDNVVGLLVMRAKIRRDGSIYNKGVQP